MPNISQYEAPIDPIHPSDKGSSSAAELAHTARVFGQEKMNLIDRSGKVLAQALDRGLTDLGHGITNYEAEAKKGKDLEELSQLNAAATNLQWQQREEYNQSVKTLDPQDTDGWKNLFDKQDAGWAEIGNNLKSDAAKKHFESMRQHQRQHNLTTFGADQSLMTVANIDRDRNTMYLAATSDLVNDPAPGHVGMILEQLNMKNKAIYDAANIPPKAQVDLVKHDNAMMDKILNEAAGSYIRKSGDPEEAFRFLKEKEVNNPYFGRVDLIKLEKYKDAEIDRRVAKSETDEKRVASQARTQIDSAQSKILLDSIQPDGKVVVAEGALDQFKNVFEQNPKLIDHAKPAEIKSFINNIRDIANKPDDYNLTPNQDKMKAITLGIAEGTMTIPQIIQARRDGEIGNQFMKSAVQELRMQDQSMKTPEFKSALSAAEKELVTTYFKGQSIQDTKGKANYNSFMQQFMGDYRKQFAEGKLEANALDTNDPDSLISKHMAPFKRDFQQVIKDSMEALTGAQQKKSSLQINPAAAKPTSQSPIELATSQLGLHEVSDKSALVSFFQKSGGPEGRIDPAVTPWCAAWANAVLRTSGYNAPNTLAARGFLKGGTEVQLDNIQKGDIMVFERGNDPSKGHVGFYAGPGDTPGTVKLLAGNQDNKVSVKEYPTDGLLGVRRYEKKDMVGVTPPGGLPPAITVPKPLQAIQNLGHNPTTGEYYDPATKRIYNNDGTPKVSVPRSE